SQTDSAIAIAERRLAYDSSETAKLRYASVLEFGDPRKAISVYEEFNKEYQNEFTLMRLAALYERLRMKSRYIETLRSIHSIDPDNQFVTESLLDALIENRQYAQVDSLLVSLTNSVSSAFHTEQYISFGTALLSDTSKQATSAIEGYARGINANHHRSAPVFEIAGYLLHRIDSTTSMMQCFARAQMLNDSTPDAAIRVGSYLLQNSFYAEVSAITKPASKKFKDEYRLPLLEAYAYSRLDSARSAIHALTRARNADSSVPEIWFQLGYLYDKLNQHDSSDFCYEKTIFLQSDFALAQNNYAYSLSLRKKKLPYALELSMSSLSKDSLNSSYLDTYGWILYQMGRHSEAETYLLKAI
ncbi:MAG: hypothetical protein JNL32_16260, partial [Candidatus Kapabacteria bacterium]|nr:hypothetical protein [Candidatus Kapabacteria bacterium]